MSAVPSFIKCRKPVIAGLDLQARVLRIDGDIAPDRLGGLADGPFWLNFDARFLDDFAGHVVEGQIKTPYQRAGESRF